MKTNIFAYIDYKQFLTDWYKTEKEESGYTHEYICMKLNLKTRAYFGDILKGRRTIGSEVFRRLVKLIGLSKNEEKYFKAIVEYGKPGNSDVREQWFEQIVQLNNTPRKIIDKKTYRFSTKWYYGTVNAYLETCDFDNDYNAASKDLYGRIAPKEVKEAIGVLKDLGMIAPDRNGFLKPTENILTTGDAIKNELFRQYQLSNNELLHSILKKDEPNTHESSLLTLSVSEKGMKRILDKVKKLRKEIMSIVHKDEDRAERVFKLALHAYPESRKSAS